MPKKKRRVPPITPEEEKLAEDALFGQGSGDEARWVGESHGKAVEICTLHEGRRLTLQCGGDPKAVGRLILSF